MNFNKFRKFVLFLTGFFIYGSIVYVAALNENKCRDNKNQETSLKCKFFPIISFPSRTLYTGFLDFKKLLIKGDISRLSAYNSYKSELRFNKYKPGFNFSYKKGSRPRSGFLLLANGDPYQNGYPNIELWDLNMQKIIKKWNLQKAINYIKRINGNIAYFNNPIITENKGLVFSTPSSGGYLIKIDSDGEVVASNDKYYFHHSINQDQNGNFYICISDKKLKGLKEGFAILDKNLNILETYFIDDIYGKYNLRPRLYSNISPAPVHINDVQPLIRKDQQKVDTVLISLKNTSSILEFNFLSNRINWIIDGITSQQHDVDIVDIEPLKISVFNNNLKIVNGQLKPEINNEIIFINGFPRTKNLNPKLIFNYSPNLEYPYPKLNIKKIDFQNLPKNLTPQTLFGGLHEVNDYYKTIIIEEGNHGRIFEYDFNANKILWTFLNKEKNNNKYYQLMWSRFYEDFPL